MMCNAFFIFVYNIGGHLNPMISFSTCITGLTEFPRMVVYIAAQIVGSIAGSYTSKYMLPPSVLSAGMLAMCSIGNEVSIGQALSLEVFGDLFVLFVAYGVALDDKQRQIFGPWLAPFIIGTLIGLLIYLTGPLQPMGNGAIAYPTRCFGPAVAMGLVTADSFELGNSGVIVNNAQWIYWIGPLIASCIHVFFYRAVPPGYTVFIQQRRQEIKEQQQQKQQPHQQQQQV